MQFSSPEVISTDYANKRFLGKIYMCPAYINRQMEYDQADYEVCGCMCICAVYVCKHNIHICVKG